MRKTVKLFKSLSDPSRIRILKMLELRPLCVCEITKVLQLATSTVSKHLSLLRDVDLIIDSKDGKWVNYELNRSTTDPEVMEMLTMIAGRLNNDSIISNDLRVVKAVNRSVICAL